VRFDVFKVIHISQCKSVKERFFNLERRFACYRRYLSEADEVAEEQELRDDVAWLRHYTGELMSRFALHRHIALRQRISPTWMVIRLRKAQQKSAPTLTDFGDFSNVL
jgi:hypothetical protein